MRIIVTGATGEIGRKLCPLMSQKFEVITMGRSDAEVIWSLGEIPDLKSFGNIDALIHLGWATKNRSRDSELNSNGTALLANYCKINRIRFLFISTLAVESKSIYGQSKLIAEKEVINSGGQVLRLGLVPECNKYFKRNLRFLGFYPNLNLTVRITYLHSLFKYLEYWCINSNSNFNKTQIKSIWDKELTFKELCDSKIKIPISEYCLTLTLRKLAPLSNKFSDFYDALISMQTQKI